MAESSARGPFSARVAGWPGGSARSLLLTVLGELVPDGNSVWTAALLSVLKGLGISIPTARQAIARAAEAGWIHSERNGRDVRWRLDRNGRDLIDQITRRVQSLHSAPPRWDRNALILNITIPTELASVRKRLYSELSWAGFGNPAPGLWASPHTDRVEETRELLNELGLRQHTVAFIGTTVDIGLADAEIVRRAWNLDEVAQRYATLIDTFADLSPESGDDVLYTYLALVHEWRKFPEMDPQLPHDLLPDWIGRRATKVFESLHQQWRPAARQRWDDIVEATRPQH